MDKMIRSIWRSYRLRLCSTRFLTTLIMVLALEAAMTTGTIRFLQEYDLQIAPYMAPHFFTNIYFTAYFGLAVCYMYSDTPFMNQAELFWVLREGRLRWCIGKIGAILLQALTLAVISVLLAAVLYIPRLTLCSDWGEVIYTLAYAQEIKVGYDTFGQAMPAIIERYTPLQAILLCLLMVTLVTTFIGWGMFALSIYAGRGSAMLFGLLCVNLEYGTTFAPSLMRLFFISPWCWVMLGLQGVRIAPDRYYPKFSYCICAVLVCLAVTLVMILLHMKRLEFRWNKED